MTANLFSKIFILFINKAHRLKQKMSRSKCLASDVMLVSYPKSGVSYLSFLIANIYELAICQKSNVKINYYNVDEYVADIHSPTFTGNTIMTTRIIKTHENAVQFRERTNTYMRGTYCRIIFLERNVEEALYSYFLYQNALDKNLGHKIDKFFKYLESRGRSQPFWDETWDRYKTEMGKGFISVRYEDLLSKPIEVLQLVCDFIGWEVEEKIIIKAVKNCSREVLSKLEADYGDGVIYDSDYSFSSKSSDTQVEGKEEILKEIARRVKVNA